ncbi:MAG TPA: glycosyltransferase family 4 protein [Oligoflexia bacterium]|nr:glycosyltransferase family 4 protein [Oligoflexia bacterium]HMP48557.1 glycosyltransferase family 4 protein [Oligoflexia bacterium]
MNKKIILFANTAWYLFNFRLSLARALRDAGYDLLLISPADEYAKRLQDEGFLWEAVPMERKSLNPLRELKLIWYLRNLYKREKPVLVHHFTIKCVILGSIAAKLAGVKGRVNAVAGLGYVFISDAVKARMLRPVVKILLSWVLNDKRSLLILQNTDDEKAFGSSGVLQRDKIRVIKGSGVNVKKFYPSERKNHADQKIKILLAARLLWDKGIGEFVEVAYSMKAAGKVALFMLAGVPDKGNPRAIDTKSIEEWKNDGAIQVLGQVDDMPELLRSVDIFILPTTYGEGVPRSLIEAGACGLPLIATDVPGCREIIEDKINGFLVPSQDIDALECAIQKLIDNPQMRNEMGKNARKKVLREFDEEIVISETLKIYKELLRRD